MGAPTKLVKAIVARGRTVQDVDGKSHRAGEEVELPAPDIARLRSRGFLTDPDRPAIPLADGPTWGSATGPRIKRG